MLGKLTWAAIPLNEPIPLVTSAVVGIVIFSILALVTVLTLVPLLGVLLIRKEAAFAAKARLTIALPAARPPQARPGGARWQAWCRAAAPAAHPSEWR